jgi:predicted RNase H-like HicB family nuclease
MNKKLTLIYWKGEKFWLGKLLEHPEIMTQGKTLKELEENIKDAFLLMTMDDVPAKYQTKEILV